MAQLLTAKPKKSPLALEEFAAYSNLGGIEARNPIDQHHTLEPNKLQSKEADSFFEKLRKKLMPIVNVRTLLNKVYSNGYFENHYKKADADLKKVLHKQTMVAHSRLNAEEEDEAPSKSRGITIHINT